MSEFNPQTLADLQSDYIEISVPRELAALVAKCLASGLSAAPDDIADQALIDDAFDVVDRLGNSRGPASIILTAPIASRAASPTNRNCMIRRSASRD